MTIDPSEKLRELALSVTRGNLRRPWSVQTSNSFRRIGTDRGDGDVLCPVTQRPDGHPDLHAPPDVLDYIVAAHPFVILQLIRERDSTRHALHLLRRKIAGHDGVFQEAGGMAGIHLAEATMGSDQAPTDRAAAVVRDVIADLTDRGGLRQAWEEIDDGIRREIVESWEKIARDQIVEVGEVPVATALGERITEMRLCEASRVVLHPHQLYRFTIAPGCQLCEVEAGIMPRSPAPAGTLTPEGAIIAARNVGVDLTCGECAALFYTGYPSVPGHPPAHDPSCRTGALAAVWRRDAPPRGVRCLVTWTGADGRSLPRVKVASVSLDYDEERWFSDGERLHHVVAWMPAPEAAEDEATP